MLALALTCGLAAAVSAQETKVKWFGQAAFQITTPNGKVIMIDPWLKNPLNPDAKDGKNPVDAITKCDYILLTHGHSDHVGEAVEIAKKTGAILVTDLELGTNLIKLQGFPKAQATSATLGNIGGAITIADGEVVVNFTPAYHSNSVMNPNAAANEPDLVYGGNPVGYVLQIKNGPTIYHTGDTSYFKDMETIGETFSIDLGLINIGGHYGMEPPMSAKAAKAVRAKLAIPHHYATNPNLTKTADGFAAELKKYNVPFYEMKVGETITFRGAKMENK